MWIGTDPLLLNYKSTRPSFAPRSPRDSNFSRDVVFSRRVLGVLFVMILGLLLLVSFLVCGPLLPILPSISTLLTLFGICCVLPLIFLSGITILLFVSVMFSSAYLRPFCFCMFLTCILLELAMSPLWIAVLAFRHFGDLTLFRNELRYRLALMFYRYACQFDLPLWIIPVFQESSPLYRTTAKKRSTYKEVYHNMFNTQFKVQLGRFLHFTDMNLGDLRLYLNYHSENLQLFTQKCLGAYLAPVRS